MTVSLTWRNGAALPVGLGGHAAAAVGDRILVAGGTTWQDGQKSWLREIRFYEPQADRWQECGLLPEAVGYGVGIAGEDCLFLIGGSEGTRASRKCYRLGFKGEQLTVTPLPDLPEGRVYAAGDRVGRRLYVVGGGSDPNRLDTAAATLFSLDLDRLSAGWQTLAPLPGRGRVNHAAAACGDALYVFGGAYLDAKGGVQNLADAYRYLPTAGRWERLPDAPIANRGWTAASDGGRRITLCGGYTATAEESAGKADDFGFTGDLLRYDVQGRSYQQAGSLPRPTVGAVPARLGKQLFLLGGEPVKRQRGAWTWITEDLRR